MTFPRAVLLVVLSITSVAAAKETSRADTAEAIKLYKKGTAYYDVLDYDNAIAAFKQAYLLTRAPELLFNIAQAYRKKGRAFCGEALELFRNYQQLEADSARRAKVTTLVDEMRECVDDQREKAVPTRVDAPVNPAPEPKPQEPPLPQPVAPSLPAVTAETAPPPHRSVLLPALLGGTGAVLVGGGVALWIESHSTYQRLSDSCAPACSPSQWQPPQTRQQLGVGAVATGAGLIGSALVVWLLERSP